MTFKENNCLIKKETRRGH